jgi:hypothetical protein
MTFDKEKHLQSPRVGNSEYRNDFSRGKPGVLEFAVMGVLLFLVTWWSANTEWAAVNAKADLYAERVKQKLKEDPDFKKTNVDKIDPKKLKLDVPA